MEEALPNLIDPLQVMFPDIYKFPSRFDTRLIKGEFCTHLLLSGSVESIHASLLVIGELFRFTGHFMLGRYKDVTAKVLAFRNHKEPIIRLTVAHLIPKLAAFSPGKFAKDHLALSVDHLLGMVQNMNAVRNWLPLLRWSYFLSVEIDVVLSTSALFFRGKISSPASGHSMKWQKQLGWG